jgi:hypothetical protein
MFRKDRVGRCFHWMLRGMGIPILLSCLAVPETALFGQRILSAVDPKAQGMDLTFDINTVTTDNVAPNIVFNASGTRGMVAFAGSGTIIAFNPQDGKITASVKTGGRPSQIVLTPDGTLLLAVDVLSNRILVVDPSNFTLKATYTFTDAAFGFGNNIVISADGKTGYITTFRNDPKFYIPTEGELIRFSIADGKEAGARLKVGISPTVITLSPDKKTIAVVNVDDINSANRTDTVSLVDVDAFSVRATVMPTADDDDTDTDPEIPADFTFVNNVSFSKDSSVAIISNRISQSTLLASDVAYVFKVSDGTILEKPAAGTVPSMSATTPDGKYFYLLNEFGYNIVDASTYQVVQQVQSPYSGFSSNSNFAFRSDSSEGFLPSQDTDGILGIKPADGGIYSVLFLTDSGGTQGAKQTMQVQVTPDGSVVCALNFQVNTLQCGVDTYNLYLSGLDVSNYLFSGFSIINTTGQAITAKIAAQDLNSTTIANDEIGFNTTTDQDQTVALAGAGRLAQSFQVVTTSSSLYIRTYIRRIGSFSDSATLKATIQTDSSSAPSGTAVEGAVVEIPANAVGTDIGFQELRFPQLVGLAELTTYWIVLEGGGSYSSEYTASTKLIEWGVDGSSPTYSNGQLSVYASSWTADANKDALFSLVLSEVSNPKDIVLAPGQQLIGTQEYFKLDDRTRSGRIRVSAEQPGLRGYWVHGSRDMAAMDGSLADSPNGYSEVLLPEVIQVADEETGFSAEQDSQVTLTGSGKLAQSFQLDKPAPISLIKLYLLKTGTFTTDAKLKVSIQADAAGVPSDIPLGDASAEIVAESSVFSILSYIFVQFDTSVSLSAGTTYWIVLEGSGTYASEYSASVNQIDWGVDSTSPAYTPGQFAAYSSGWTADSEKDALFSVVVAANLNLATSFNLINRYHNFVSASYELFDGEGNLEVQQSASLPGIVRLIQGLDQLFSSGVTDRQGGYLKVLAAGEITAFEEFGTETSTAILPGIPLDSAAYANQKLYFPRVAAGPNIQTLVNVINLSRQSGYATGQDDVVALTGTGKLAQSFQLDEAANISLIRILLQESGDFSDTAKVKLSIQEDSSGAPSGTPLSGATAEIAVDSIQSSLAVTNLRFNAPVALKKGTTYWLVLEGSGTYGTEYIATNMVVEWGVDSSTPTYTKGQFSVYADSKWTADAEQDALFEIVLSEDNEITLSLYSPTGKLLAPPYKKTLAAGGQLRDLLANLFPSFGSKEFEGWVLVEGSKPGIVGDVIFSNLNADYIAAGLLQMAPMKDILFAQVAQGSDFETGWLLLNAGDLPADVTMELHDTSGAIRSTRTLRISGRNSLDLAFADVFTNLKELLGGYMVLHSSQPLYTFSLMSNGAQSFLCSIPPQPFP